MKIIKSPLSYFRYSNISKKEILQFFLIFILSILIVYFTPQIIIQVYFIVLLILFWQSEKNYLWIVIFFIFIEEPAGFFTGGLASDIKRLPLYSISKGMSFSFQDLFIIVFFLKAFQKGKKINLLYQKNLNILFFYLIFLYIVSMVYGMSIDKHIYTIRRLMPLSLFIAIPYLIHKSEDYFHMYYLLSIVMIFILMSQLFELFTRVKLVSFFKTPSLYDNISIDTTDRLLRIIETPMINLYCFIMTLFLLSSRQYHLKKGYLYIIFTICIFSIYLSATRGWIVSYALMILLFIWFNTKNPVNIIKRFSVPVIILVIIYISMPNVQIQVQKVFNRLETLEYLIKGDITAGGTLKRLDIRSPRVMSKFKESPIIGFGFSNEYYQYADLHVGNQNLLLNAGIIGYLLFLYFWINFNKEIYQIKKRLPVLHRYKNSIMIFFAGFVGIFIIHSTSMQFFDYIIGYNRGMILALFFSLANIVIKEIRMEARNENKNMLNSDV